MLLYRKSGIGLMTMFESQGDTIRKLDLEAFIV
jgi:hypothetical protein